MIRVANKWGAVLGGAFVCCLEISALKTKQHSFYAEACIKRKECSSSMRYVYKLLLPVYGVQ